jgi:exodeoxyribonuclease VII small subunit
MAKSGEKIGDKLNKLNSIVAWFESREQVDVEEGLAKVKEGAALIKELRGKLRQVENEFTEIKKELDETTKD